MKCSFTYETKHMTLIWCFTWQVLTSVSTHLTPVQRAMMSVPLCPPADHSTSPPPTPSMPLTDSMPVHLLHHLHRAWGECLASFLSLSPCLIFCLSFPIFPHLCFSFLLWFSLCFCFFLACGLSHWFPFFHFLFLYLLKFLCVGFSPSFRFPCIVFYLVFIYLSVVFHVSYFLLYAYLLNHFIRYILLLPFLSTVLSL